jgi:hypothetical protein
MYTGSTSIPEKSPQGDARSTGNTVESPQMLQQVPGRIGRTRESVQYEDQQLLLIYCIGRDPLFYSLSEVFINISHNRRQADIMHPLRHQTR